MYPTNENESKKETTDVTASSTMNSWKRKLKIVVPMDDYDDEVDEIFHVFRRKEIEDVSDAMNRMNLIPRPVKRVKRLHFFGRDL